MGIVGTLALRVRGAQRVGERLVVGAGTQRLVGVDRLIEADGDGSLLTGRGAGEQRQRRAADRRPAMPALAFACSGDASENAPLTRRPGALLLGSTTDSAASPAVEITVAVVEAE